MLETIPSFSFSALWGHYEDEDEEDEDQSDVQDEEERAELEENVAENPKILIFFFKTSIVSKKLRGNDTILKCFMEMT
jgi:hypothetical protein